MAAPVDCTGEGRCYVFAVTAPVRAGALPGGRARRGHLRRRASGARRGGGRLHVEAELDASAPEVDPPLLETVGDCLRVRFATDEPARASLVVRAGGLEQVLAAGEGSTLFDVAARLVAAAGGGAPASWWCARSTGRATAASRGRCR